MFFYDLINLAKALIARLPGGAVVNAWSTADQMRGNEVPREKESDACGTSQTKRALRDELRNRLLPNDANNEQAGGQNKGIDDEWMREDVLSERPPFAHQAKAEPSSANRAIPVAQASSPPGHRVGLRPASENHTK